MCWRRPGTGCGPRAPSRRRPRPSWAGSSSRARTQASSFRILGADVQGRARTVRLPRMGQHARKPAAAAGTADLGRAAMDGTTTGTATACWTSLGFLVHLTVTEPGALPAAPELLEADVAALDAACSRFRPNSELAGLD